MKTTLFTHLSLISIAIAVLGLPGAKAGGIVQASDKTVGATQAASGK